MKRSKEVGHGRAREVGDGFWQRKPTTEATERAYSWEADVVSQADSAFVPYAPTLRFARGTLIAHPKFGKGIVARADGAAIDVLFQEGSRKLAQNPAGALAAPPQP